MHDAIIVGGGISGLTAGHLLASQGSDTIILEKREAPGGPISTYRASGYTVERGPNSLLLPAPWVETFIDELDLAEAIQNPNPLAAKRYIVRNGRPVAVPASPWRAIATPLFSLRAKLGILGEPFRKPISAEAATTETVASFATRRLGREFLDYAIGPFVNGIYAGDPEELVLQYAFPAIHAFERDGGSILRGAVKYKRRRKTEGTSYRKRSISFEGGLRVLPLTLAKRLDERLRLAASVKRIERVETGWQVYWQDEHGEQNARSRQVLICLPSHATKAITWDTEIGQLLAEAPDLPYPTVHSLALGYRKDQIKHPLDGFGVLVPQREPFSILGAIFSSSVFNGKAPAGHALLTVMLGGRTRPDLANATREELLAISRASLSRLLGVVGEPEFVELTTWPRAIPQYTLAFGPWSQTLREIEKTFDGIHFGGHAIDGIALGASILSGKRVAEKARAMLAN